MSLDESQPTLVPPRAGTVLEFLGVTHKLTSQQTGGAYYVFETTFDAGAGNRLHRHHREDEIGYVLEGSLEIRLEDRITALDAGGLAQLPKGIAHAIRNPLEMASRYLFIVVPGGLDRWFDAVAEANDRGTLDAATYAALSHEYEIDWLE